MIDVEVFGDPHSCWEAAISVLSASQALKTAAKQVNRERSRAASSWSGAAADAFLNKCRETQSDLDTIVQRVHDGGVALDAFADELSAVKLAMKGAVEMASMGGLTVAGHFIFEPTLDGLATSGIQGPAVTSLGGVWKQVVDLVDDARARESAAHAALISALGKISGDGWLTSIVAKFGFLPTSGGYMGTVVWGTGTSATGLGLASDWMTTARYGDFRPKGPKSRFVKKGSLTALERFKFGLDPKSFQAKAYKAAARNTWMVRGEWIGRLGVGVSFGSAAYDQWNADKDDKSLGTTERVARSATEGVATAAGAWAGAESGATLGVAIGTMILPGTGSVIGGAVGGLVGGFVGSEVGGAVGGFVKGGVGDAADAVSGAASGVGDVLKFWD